MDPSNLSTASLACLSIKRVITSMKQNRKNSSFLAEQCKNLLGLVAGSGLLPFQLEENLLSESMLSLLVAIKTHPKDDDLLEYATMVLSFLVVLPETPAGNSNPIKSNAALELVSIMERKAVDKESVVAGIMKVVGRLVNEEGGQIGTLLGAGFTPAVVSCMSKHPLNPSIQLLGCLSLINSKLCGEKEEHLVQSIGAVHNAIKQFASKCKHSFNELGPIEGEVAGACCRYLYSLLGAHPSAVSHFYSVGGPQQTISMMRTTQPGNAFLQGLLGQTLLHFADHDDQWLRCQCFHSLLLAFQSHSEEHVLRMATSTFIQVLLQTKDGALLLFDSGKIPCFFRLIEQNLEDFETAVCKTVFVLGQYQETRSAVMTGKAASLVVKAASSGALEEAVCGVLCLGALGLLWTSNVQEEVDEIMLCGDGAGASMKIIKSFPEHDTVGELGVKLCTLVVKRLFLSIELSDGMSITAGWLNNYCVVDCILHAMACQPQDEGVQTMGCTALGLLTSTGKFSILEAVAKADGVNILLDAIENFTENESIFDLGGIAALLVREFENEAMDAKSG